MRTEETGAMRLLILLGLLVLTVLVTATAQVCQGDIAHVSKSGLVKVQSCPALMKSTSLSQPKNIRLKSTGTPSVHDVAVVQVSAPEEAAIGTTLRVNSTIVNYGTATEHPEVQLLVNETLVGTDPSVAVASHSASISKISWNTTGYRPGVYGLEVKAISVMGERVITNNILHGIFVTLTQQPPAVPSSSAPPATGSSNQIVLVIALAEALGFSFLALGRRSPPGWARLVRRSAHFVIRNRLYSVLSLRI